jgi:hypothetical protein
MPTLTVRWKFLAGWLKCATFPVRFCVQAAGSPILKPAVAVSSAALKSCQTQPDGSSGAVLPVLVDGDGDGLADGLALGLADGDSCVLGLVLALADELGFRDAPADGLPFEGECPEEAGAPAPPALLAPGVLAWLPPDLAEPPPADLSGVDTTGPDAPGGEEFSAYVVCVWE